MSLILDAGAFLAIERRDRDVLALLKDELLAGRAPVTHAGVVGQVWRAGGRQAHLARALHATRIVPLDDLLGRRSGVLLGRAKRADVIDAALVLLATDGDTILTSDPRDIGALVAVARVSVAVIDV